MTVITFMGRSILYGAMLYGYYYYFLRNRRFHHYNRFYVLAACLAGLLLPFFYIPLSLAGSQRVMPLIKTLDVISVGSWEEPVTIYANASGLAWLNWQNIIAVLCLAGFVFCIAGFLRSLQYINRMRRQYPYTNLHRVRMYHTHEPGTPFSFFRNIFWDEKINPDSQKGHQILRHEMYHVKQWHSADLMFAEIVSALAWFNPFLHLFKRELRAIHEFLADEDAASIHNRQQYAETLVLQAITQKKPTLVHPFFNTLIKRRVMMITQNTISRKGTYVGRILALPILFMFISAFAIKINRSAQPSNHYNPQPVTVVIDAGHGGLFPGAKSDNGVLEKDINLAIAQKINQLAPSYNVNVLMTRNTDQTIGNATDLSTDLSNRVDLVNNAKPDLMISVHVNFSAQNAPANGGFDAFISGRRSDASSRQLASAVLSNLKQIYPTAAAIHEAASGVAVLDKSSCPAILLECGYINNQADLAFVTNAANQEKIARAILEAIVVYNNNKTAATAETPGPAITANREYAPVGGPALLYDDRFEVANSTQLPGETLQEADTVPTPDVYGKVEQEADYPGGQQGWINYLTSHLKYPEKAVKKNIQGTVVVQFIVDKEGNVSDIQALSGPEELKAPSIKVIRDSGKWTPARQNGREVKAYKKQPIIYKLLG